MEAEALKVLVCYFFYLFQIFKRLAERAKPNISINIFPQRKGAMDWGKVGRNTRSVAKNSTNPRDSGTKTRVSVVSYRESSKTQLLNCVENLVF